MVRTLTSALLHESPVVDLGGGGGGLGELGFFSIFVEMRKRLRMVEDVTN